jgi:hypothetical protein
MKSTDFKKIIKEAVREAIQEELKEILLEAVKAPKQLVRGAYNPPPRTPEPSFTQPTYFDFKMDLKSKYMDILGETALSFTSNDVQQPFRPQSVDPINGSLGEGEIGMDQIMKLMSK